MIDPRFLELLHAHLRYLDADTALTPDADLRALGLDSMEAVNLMLDIEDEFAVVLPDSALTAVTFGSAEALWAAVADARAGTHSPSSHP
jgi:acyl carrier protein